MPTRIAVSSKTTPSASVKSAARVLSIFEYFDRMRSPRTLSEISQDLDYPVSSTLALLRSVQGMGYLNYNHDRKSYSPSVRFALLGKWIHDSIFEGATVQIMEQLAAVTKETVLLSIQNGFQSQHVRIIETAQPLRYHPLVGTLRPLLRSAVGRVLLAQQPKAAVLKIIERINTLQADGGRVFKPQDVLDDLTAVRKLGYAFSSNLFEPGAAIVAVALPWRAGEVQMAVSVGGPASRISKKSFSKLAGLTQQCISQYIIAPGKPLS